MKRGSKPQRSTSERRAASERRAEAARAGTSPERPRGRQAPVRKARPPREPGGLERFLPTLPFAISGAVAAVYFLLSLADGGFGPAVWAEATILVWWVAFAALLAGAWPRSRIPAAAGIAGACLFGLTALTGVSIAWASDLGAAYEDALRGAGYLGIFVLAAIAARAGAGQAFLSGLAVGLFAVCAIALLSRLEPGLIESRDEARGLRVSGGRLGYPIGYWNALAACAACALPLLIWLSASATAAARRALAAAAVPIAFLALFFSGSRGGGIAAAAAIVVLLLAGPRRVTLASIVALTLVPATLVSGIAAQTPDLINGAQNDVAAGAGDRVLIFTILASIGIAAVVMLADRKVARLHLPVVGARRAAVIFGVLATLALLVADPVNRLRSFDDPPATVQATAEGSRFQSEGSSGRAQFWDSAVDAFVSEPVRGIGAGGFESWWAVDGSLDFTVTHAHSLFLETAAELGLLGPLLALGFLAIPAVAGVRRLRAPTSWAGSETATGAVGAALAVLAAGATAAAFDWIWDVPSAFIPAVVAAAFLCVRPVSGVENVANPAATMSRPRLRSFGTAAIVGVVGLASIAAAIAMLLSEQALIRSESAVADGRLGDAAAEARKASDALPFAARPYRQLALIEASRGRPNAAIKAIDEAQERATEDWELRFLEGGFDFQANRLGEGVYNLNSAEALNTKAPERLFVPPATQP